MFIFIQVRSRIGSRINSSGSSSSVIFLSFSRMHLDALVQGLIK